MLFKILVVGVLVLILVSLGSALFGVVKDHGQGQRAVKALTVRVALSVGLFVLLMVGYGLGLITPHAM
ncbi:MAG: hypothetical protein AMJ69_01480 [Gammaproteobacteria bacterium SG8_47]|nr:MAG: hypothetical protein AMJ69_01480 [Gammaproteobacteria bacterium SG8_47]